MGQNRFRFVSSWVLLRNCGASRLPPGGPATVVVAAVVL